MSSPDAVKLVAQVKAAEQQAISIVLSEDPLVLSMQWREELNMLLEEWSHLNPDLQAVLLSRREFLFSYARFLDHVDPKAPHWNSRIKSLYKKYLHQSRDSGLNADKATARSGPAAHLPGPVVAKTSTSQAGSSGIHLSSPGAASKEPPFSADGVGLLRSPPVTKISVPRDAPLVPKATTGRVAFNASCPPASGDTLFESEDQTDAIQPRPLAKTSAVKVASAEQKPLTSSRKNLAVPSNKVHDPPCAMCKARGSICRQNVSGGACCDCRTGKQKCDYARKRYTKVNPPPASVASKLSEQERGDDEPAEGHNVENRIQHFIEIPSDTGSRPLPPPAAATADVDTAKKNVIGRDVLIQEGHVADAMLKPLRTVHSEGPTHDTSPMRVPMGIGSEQPGKSTPPATHLSPGALDKHAVDPLMTRVMDLESEVHGLAQRLDLIADILSLNPGQALGQAVGSSAIPAPQRRVISNGGPTYTTPVSSRIPPQSPRAPALPHVHLPAKPSILRNAVNGKSSSSSSARVPVIAVPAPGGRIQAQGTPFYGPNAIAPRSTMSDESASSHSNTTDTSSDEEDDPRQGGSSIGTPEDTLLTMAPSPPTPSSPLTVESTASGYPHTLAAAAADLTKANSNLLSRDSANLRVENGSPNLDLAATSYMSTHIEDLTIPQMGRPQTDAELLPVATTPLLEPLAASPLPIATLSRRYHESYDEEVDFSGTDDEAPGHDVAGMGKAQPQMVPIPLGEHQLLPPDKSSMANSKRSQTTPKDVLTFSREEGDYPEQSSLRRSLRHLTPNIALPPALDSNKRGKRKDGPSGLQGRVQKRPKE